MYQVEATTLEIISTALSMPFLPLDPVAAHEVTLPFTTWNQ